MTKGACRVTGKKVTDIREAMSRVRMPTHKEVRLRLLLEEIEFERERRMLRLMHIELWLWRISTLAWTLTTFVWYWRSRHG